MVPGGDHGPAPLTPNGAAGLELCLSIFDGYDLDSAAATRA